MGSGPVVAQSRIDDAAKRVDAVYQQLQREAAENRRAYERFYTNLALFSGGTIALSVTFLGYLMSRPDPVSDKWLIVATWASLLVCLASSLFQSLFHAHYLHYTRLGEYQDKQREKHGVELNELPKLPIANPSDLPAFQENLKQAIDALKKNKPWIETRQKGWNFLDVWSSRLARTAFLAGFALLFAFAVRQLQ